MQLFAKPILGFIFDTFFRHSRVLRLRPDGVEIQGGPRDWMGFDNLSVAPSVTNNFLSLTICLAIENPDTILLRAVSPTAAQACAVTLEVAWQRFSLLRIEAEQEQINSLLITLRGPESAQSFPSASRLEAAWKLAAELHRNLLSKLKPEAIGPDWVTLLAPISDFATDPEKTRVAAIERYVEAELSRWKALFDTIETNPLTPE